MKLSDRQIANTTIYKYGADEIFHRLHCLVCVTGRAGLLRPFLRLGKGFKS